MSVTAASTISDAQSAAEDQFLAAAAAAAEHTHRSLTVHRYLLHEDSWADAAIIMNATNSLIEKGMNHITRELGFDAWSRNLSDYEAAYAFILPEHVYMEDTDEMADFRDTLTNYMKAIFNAYYIYADMEWRESSADIDYPENSIYEVDAFGSRSRSVNMGHHLYITFRARNVGTRRPPLDPAPAKLVWSETRKCPYMWAIECDEPDAYSVNYSVNRMDFTQNTSVNLKTAPIVFADSAVNTVVELK